MQESATSMQQNYNNKKSPTDSSKTLRKEKNKSKKFSIDPNAVISMEKFMNVVLHNLSID